MKLKLMILDRNIKTSENNDSDSWEKISNKLEEEYQEVQEAIREADREYIAEEIFDLLQVSIRAFVLLTKEKFNIEQLNMRHNKKLVNRGWKEKKIINIFIKEWFYMSRLEEVRNLAEGLVEIQVDFIDKDNGRKQGLIFYTFENFGKWYADNYDTVEILEVIQSEE